MPCRACMSREEYISKKCRSPPLPASANPCRMKLAPGVTARGHQPPSAGRTRSQGNECQGNLCHSPDTHSSHSTASPLGFGAVSTGTPFPPSGTPLGITGTPLVATGTQVTPTGIPLTPTGVRPVVKGVRLVAGGVRPVVKRVRL